MHERIKQQLQNGGKKYLVYGGLMLAVLTYLVTGLIQADRTRQKVNSPSTGNEALFNQIGSMRSDISDIKTSVGRIEGYMARGQRGRNER